MSDGAAPHESHDASRSGIVIAIAAVIVAIVLLGKGYSSGDSGISTASTTPKTTTTIEPTVTTLASRPPADVKVKSVNATSTTGLAGKVRDMLNARGYTQVTLGDATNKQQASTVFFMPGNEAEAVAVARALGLDASVVRPMPDPQPVSPGDASVMVMAGVDLA